MSTKEPVFGWKGSPSNRQSHRLDHVKLGSKHEPGLLHNQWAGSKHSSLPENESENLLAWTRYLPHSMQEGWSVVNWIRGLMGQRAGCRVSEVYDAMMGQLGELWNGATPGPTGLGKGEEHLK